MKKFLNLLAIAILSLCLLLTGGITVPHTFPADLWKVYAEDDVASGVYDEVPWRITSGYKLIIGEEGAEYTYTYRSRRIESYYPWDDYRKQLVACEFQGTVHGNGVHDCMFSGFTNATSISLKGFDTSQVTSMNSMFSSCQKVTSLNLSGFDTSNVTSMNGMFWGNLSLKSLDVSGFDTSNLKKAEYMFCMCRNLRILNITGFSCENVSSMEAMFANCESLSQLDVFNLKPRNLTNMAEMFSCIGVKSLDISGLDTSNVTNMASLFSGTKVENLDLSTIDTTKVKNMSGFFAGAKVKHLDVESLSTSNVTNMSGMFSGCENIESLDLSGFDTSKVTDMSNMFFRCTYLEDLNISSFDTSNVSNMMQMFAHCQSLYTLDLSTLNTESLTNVKAMFSGCYNLENLDLSSFNITSSTTRTDFLTGVTLLNRIVLGKGIKTISGCSWESAESWESEKSGEVYTLEDLISRYSENPDEMYGVYNKTHTWNDDYTVDKESTCSEKGCESIHCSVCGRKKDNSERELPLADHIWSEDYTTDKNPSCTDEGLMSLHCKDCGAIKEGSEVPVPKVNHAFDDWVITKAPTCINAGQKEQICSMCGDIITEEIPATGEHAFGQWSTLKNPTCIENGSKQRECSICHQVEEEEIPATGHDWEEPTYTWSFDNSEVTASRTCKNDPSHIQSETSKVTSEITKEATCEEPGELTLTAAFTNKTFWSQVKVIEIEALGHDYHDVDGSAVAPTCETAGREADRKCSRCDSIIKGKALDALGHHFGEWITVKEPTYDEAGLKERTCSACGRVEQEEIPMLDRTSVEGATVSGIKAKVYTGKVFTQDPLVQIGDVILEEGTDYELSYSNNKNVGMATVTITGIGSYKDSISKTFRINPKGTTLANLTAAKKGFTAKWKKQATRTTGYQLQYSTSSSFKSGNKTVTISKNKTISKKVTKLKAKKKYYVRVRTYKTIGGTKYYSAWSKAKTVKTK